MPYHQIKKPTDNHGNRKYGEDDVLRWRKMIRENRLSKAAIQRIEGVKSSTMDKYKTLLKKEYR